MYIESEFENYTLLSLSINFNFNFVLNVFGTPIFNANALVQIMIIPILEIYTENFDAASIVSIASGNTDIVIIIIANQNTSIVTVVIARGNSSSSIVIVFLTTRWKVVAAEPTLRAPSYNHRSPHHCSVSQNTALQ